jgi:uncharacterized membrane protein YczE
MGADGHSKSKTKARSTADWLAAWPFVDQVLPIVAVVLWVRFAQQWVPLMESPRLYFYAAVSTLAGLALAAATFVCAMTYQARSFLMDAAQKKFSKEFRRNWTSIILWVLAAALLPLAAMVADSHSSAVAFPIAFYALVLTAVKVARIVFWLRFTLFMEGSSKSLPEEARMSPPRRRNAAGK